MINKILKTLMNEWLNNSKDYSLKWREQPCSKCMKAEVETTSVLVSSSDHTVENSTCHSSMTRFVWTVTCPELSWFSTYKMFIIIRATQD